MAEPLRIPEELWGRMTPAVRAFIESLLARIEDLESRLPKTPQNSSLPPSMQHPHAKPALSRPPSRRKQGGQPGHEKHERALVPTERCSEVVLLWPDACRCCGCELLRDRLAGEDSAPLRHQVYVLPEIKPIITEYQRHRLGCPDCGASTCVPL